MLADEAGVGDSTVGRPILLVHGDADPMIPVTALQQAKTALEAADFIVESHVSRGLAHSIDMDGLQLGGRFLHRVLGTGDQPR